MNLSALSLYLVTDRHLALGRPLENIITEALEGGVTMIQLREKEASSREFYELALRLKPLCHDYNVPLIINDRLDIMLATDADGLHLGQSDLPCPIARKLIGSHKILGLSVETLEQAEQAQTLPLDYIGISPVFSTQTKTDTAPAVGLEGIKAIKEHCSLPAVGIGGIHLNNAFDIIKSGADGIAVVSAIMSAPEPRNAAQKLKEEVQKALIQSHIC